MLNKKMKQIMLLNGKRKKPKLNVHLCAECADVHWVEEAWMKNNVGGTTLFSEAVDLKTTTSIHASVVPPLAIKNINEHKPFISLFSFLSI